MAFTASRGKRAMTRTGAVAQKNDRPPTVLGRALCRRSMDLAPDNSSGHVVSYRENGPLEPMV